MKIEHFAVWVHDLEKMKEFYEKYFDAESGELYHNPTKGFRSYFLSFAEGARLELMNKDGLGANDQERFGYAHLAMSLGSKERVDELTETFKRDGFPVLNGPRTTGDGYYESVIEDPEGNLVELTV